MASKQHIYGEVNNKSDMKHVFSEIRGDVEHAKSRSDLTELYKRAGYLITLTNSPAWKKKFKGEVKELQQLGEEEFQKTAKWINQRARVIDTEADYDEKWGD